MVEELSRQDGSVGWCTAIAAGHSRFAGALLKEIACEIFGSGRTVLAGALSPTGCAVAVPGGYRVIGRWAYGSVIDHSSWVYGNCVIYDETLASRDHRYLARRRPARYWQSRFPSDRTVRA